MAKKKNIGKKKIDAFVKLEFTQNVDVRDVICKIIDKVGAKRTIDYVLSQCLWNTLENCGFVASILANENDKVEQAEVAAAIYYLKQNWKEASEKGMKLLKGKMKEAQEKV